ncbi:MAG: hypothetical protein IJS62_03690 [Bacteroidales bacterium]|nr:hypothetical protein [Bacteroidales bacterium]
MTEYKSKHGVVSRSREELYMSFTDLSRIREMLPEDKKAMVFADYDHLSATVQNFTVGVRITGRQPYERIELSNAEGAPFAFSILLHFGDAGMPGKTDFSITVEADLNLVMKAMLGGKIQSGLDKIVEGIVDVSEGRIPEGMPQGMKF